MYVNDLSVAVKKAATKRAARGYAKQTLFCSGWEAEAPRRLACTRTGNTCVPLHAPPPCAPTSVPGVHVPVTARRLL